jgi:hypothetical protein
MTNLTEAQNFIIDFVRSKDIKQEDKDSIVINTTTSVTKSEYNLCTVGESTDTYSLLNANINGCDCCNIIIT